MLFDSLGQIGRVVANGVLAYVALLVLLRLAGKRTLAKLNAFDLVVTVALGSTLASILLSSDVALAEGAAAFAVLVLAQFLVAWTSVRVHRVRALVKAEPTLLLRDGVLREAPLRQMRVTAGEVRQALRSSGIGGLDQVAAVVLETDGTLSVIPASSLGDGSALRDVGGWRIGAAETGR